MRPPRLSLADAAARCHFPRGVKGTLFAAVLISWAAVANARPPAPLYDPVALNIGLSCQWQYRCIADQTNAMRRALKYVRSKQPPSWQIQTCNRNASRRHFRMDWIGFENCIRNAAVPARTVRKRTRGYTERSESRSSAIGERGH